MMSCGVLQPHHSDLIRYDATCRPKRLHPDKTATLLQALMTDLQAAGAWTFVAKTRCRHQAAPRSACCSCVPLSPDSHCGAGGDVQGEGGAHQSHRDAQARTMTRLPAHTCGGWPWAEQAPSDKHPIMLSASLDQSKHPATSLTSLSLVIVMRDTSVPS